MIDSVSRRHGKMRDFDDERVHQLTLCPNSDAGMIVAFADKAWSEHTRCSGVNGISGGRWCSASQPEGFALACQMESVKRRINV